MGFRLLCLRKQKNLPQAVHRPRSLAAGGVRVQLNQSVVPTLQLRRPLGHGAGLPHGYKVSAGVPDFTSAYFIGQRRRAGSVNRSPEPFWLDQPRPITNGSGKCNFFYFSPLKNHLGGGLTLSSRAQTDQSPLLELHARSVPHKPHSGPLWVGRSVPPPPATALLREDPDLLWGPLPLSIFAQGWIWLTADARCPGAKPRPSIQLPLRDDVEPGLPNVADPGQTPLGRWLP